MQREMEAVLAEVQKGAVHNQGQRAIVGLLKIRRTRFSFIIRELRETHIGVRVIIL